MPVRPPNSGSRYELRSFERTTTHGRFTAARSRTLLWLSLPHLIHLARAYTVTTLAGTGHAGYNGDGIPAFSAQLDNPVSVAVSKNGSALGPDTSSALMCETSNRPAAARTAACSVKMPPS